MRGSSFGKSQAARFGMTLIVLAVMACARPANAQDVPPVEQPANVEKQPINRKPTPAGTIKARPTTQKTGIAKPSPANPFDPVRVLLALGGVIALIFIGKWGVKRLFGVSSAPRSSRAVQVLSRSTLTPRQQLVVLRVGRRLLIVADGGGQMSTLSEITDADEVAALLGQLQDDHGDRAGKAFANFFNKMRGRYDDDDASGETASESPILRPVGGSQGRLFDREDGTQQDDPAIGSTRQEINGLMDKIRLLSRQFKG